MDAYCKKCKMGVGATSKVFLSWIKTFKKTHKNCK